MKSRSLAAAAALALSAAAAFGQGGPTPQQRQQLQSIKWNNGPCVGKIGTVATIDVPAGFQFTEAQGAQTLLRLAGNPHVGGVLGLLQSTDKDESWILDFTFEDTGYVKDDEKDKIDAAGLLAQIREGNDNSNQERKKMGAAPLEVVGWDEAPFYDTQHHRLTWAIRGRSEGNFIVNYNSKLLGRGGVMAANLIIDPEELAKTKPTYNKLLDGFKFNPGQTYAEWKPGDKVAAYGLGALVVGGAGVALVKSGLLGKLLKPILVGLVVVGGAIMSFFKKLFGGRQQQN